MDLPAPLDRQAIDFVLLDMDGTLLDKHFDDYFWEEYVPRQYAKRHQLDENEAKALLLARYRAEENTLNWTDLDFWSRELGLDIPELKLRIDHLIRVHPHVEPFLRYCHEQGMHTALVTNAHPKTLAIKLRRSRIGHLFDTIVCSEVIGLPKEDTEFWRRLQKELGFDPARTLLADDSERVLAAAEAFGIAHLVQVAKPSSRQPVKTDPRYPAIVTFQDLLPPVSAG